MSQMMDQHLWKNRVVLLFAEDSRSGPLNKQLALFKEYGPGKNDRDLVIYQIFKDHGKGPGELELSAEKAKELRRRYEVPGEGYTFILLGKDGTVKLRERELVSIERLFSLIDSMPMRRAEMRRQKEEDGG